MPATPSALAIWDNLRNACARASRASLNRKDGTLPDSPDLEPDVRRLARHGARAVI